jgi:hypothetical protein
MHGKHDKHTHTAKQYSNWFHYNKIIWATSLSQDMPEELCDIINHVDQSYIADNIPKNSCATEAIQDIPIKNRRGR